MKTVLGKCHVMLMYFCCRLRCCRS